MHVLLPKDGSRLIKLIAQCVSLLLQQDDANNKYQLEQSVPWVQNGPLYVPPALHTVKAQNIYTGDGNGLWYPIRIRWNTSFHSPLFSFISFAHHVAEP